MSEHPFSPICTILAGANGSGKSSAAELWLNLPGETVHADQLARLIDPQDPEAVSIAAARAALARLDELIEQRQSFNFETTLSSHQAIRLMERAVAAGYRVELVFVVLETIELHILRVRQRVAQGGHNIPVAAIRRRFGIALSRLAAAIRLAEQTVVIDNTGTTPEPLVKINARRLDMSVLSGASPLHRRLAGAVADALDVPVEAVLMT